MRVLFITPPKDIARSDVTKPTVCTQPLGIAYLAAVLEKNGTTVGIMDGYSLGHTPEQVTKEIAEFRPTVVGISSFTNNIYDAYEVARLSKSVLPNAPVIIGGPHATALPKEVIENDHVDVAFIGEGEADIYELCAQLSRAEWPLTVPNLLYKHNGNTEETQRSAAPVDLDSIPFPAHNLLPDIALYNPYPHWGKAGRFSALITSRGCPYNCMFCSVTSAQGQRYRARSVNNIIDEIRMLTGDYGVTTLSFRDGTVATSRQRLKDLCEELIASDLKVDWNCTVRANEIDVEIAQLMKRAGCSAAQLGIEVGNPEMLKRIKNLTPEQVKQAVNAMAAAGIRVHGYFMFGLPGETESTMRETIHFACRLPLYSAGFAAATPYPGTHFFQYCDEKDLLLTRQWDHYDAQSVVFSHETVAGEKILKAQKSGFRRFYLRPRTALRILRQISTPADIKNYMHLGWNFLVK